MPTLDLKDKVAFVTGAGTGIGLATARILSHCGAHVGLLGRTAATIEKAAAELRSSGCEALGLVGDVRDPAQIEAALGQVIERWGKLDIVFANAGVNGTWAPIEEITPEEWDHTMSINLRGTFLTVRACVPHLKKNGGGSMIINSSVNGTRMFSNTGATPYACSKAAQVAMAKMLALELAPHRIRVNVICPGWIESEIESSSDKRNLETLGTRVEFPDGAVPLTDGAAGKAEQVGQVVLFLASDLSDHVSGTEIWVDGAQSLLQG